jgi:hypothetical protein
MGALAAGAFGTCEALDAGTDCDWVAGAIARRTKNSAARLISVNI